MQPSNPFENPKLPAPSEGTAEIPQHLWRRRCRPGSSIEQAARAVASRRGGGSYGGGGSGSYGAGPGGSALKMGPLEVLSDTQGVDFGPYLERVMQAVRMNWYAIIPEEARPPLLKKGKVAIQFAILPDGKSRRHAALRDRQATRHWTAQPGAALPRRLRSRRCPASSTDRTWRCASASTTTPARGIWNREALSRQHSALSIHS